MDIDGKQWDFVHSVFEWAHKPVDGMTTDEGENQIERVTDGWEGGTIYGERSVDQDKIPPKIAQPPTDYKKDQEKETRENERIEIWYN